MNRVSSSQQRAEPATGRNRGNDTAPDALLRQPTEDAADVLRKVYLEITTECDLDCRMCIRHVWDEPVRRMTDQTFEAALAGLRSLPTVREVQFGGFGEPTTHPRFLDFLQSVKEAGLHAELVTNGAGLKQEFLDRLVDLELDHLVVSIDGESAADDGVFHPEPARARQNLRALYRTKLLRHASKPEVTVEFVASNANIDQLPEVKRLGQMLGFDRVLVTNLIPYDPALSGQVLYERWTTVKADTKACSWNPVIDLPRMDARSEASRVIEKLELTGSNLRVLGVDPTAGGMHCRFIHEGRTVIDPDGNVSPCLGLSHKYRYCFRGEERHMRAFLVGNVNRIVLGGIWDDPRYRGFRNRVRRWQFAPCINCGGCELRGSNESDCLGNEFPCCGACLWAAGIVQCP
jgi:MoaA/NifB/PqqE/SkfB family radical SAM enzyme